MKKLTFLPLLALLLLSTATLAQNPVIGLKAGLNLTTMGGDAKEVSSKASFHIGAFTKVPVQDNAVFQPELVYSSQGGKTNNDLLGDATFNYNYLNVPLMFKFLPDGEGFHVHAGPQIGFLMSGKVSTDNIDFDVKDQLNGIDLAIGFGAGYDIDRFIVDFRYNLGLNSTLKDDAEGSSPMRTFQFSIGLVL